ncbi:MAG TPA: serine/threonine protein kinase, partial [Nannocystis exedens]|nr:serine/threonine protein kinase [Nannocystis exedens]
MDDGDGDKKPGQVGEGQNIYEVIELIGKGGMAEVWRGRHTRHGRDVAIKFIAAKHRGRDDIAKRFRHEINILLRLNHPHIVTVYDHGKSDDGRLYLVMELLHGPTLEELLRKSTCGQFIDWHTQISIAQQVCNALDATHAQGLVHRDIKPSNISCLPMANQSVHVKLLDFGIAKVREDLKQDRQDESEELTAIGAFIGTHHYAAPEMIRPHEFGVPDGRADLFSLGVVLYRCATGMRPFQGDPNNVVLWKTCTERPPSPRERAPDRQIPASLDALIMR